MTQPGLLELAKQGDPQAIAVLINHQLQPKGIFAKANTIKGCLQIIFEATEVPPQQIIANYVYTAISKLKAPSIEKVIIYGKQTGNDFPVWQQEFDFLNTQSLNDKQPKILSSEVIKPSISKNATILECHGNATILAVQNDGVLIKRLGGLLSSHVKGERFISYNNIVNIQFHNSSSLSYGFIYFQLPGYPGNIKYLAAASTLDAVVFYHDKFSEFDKARFLILEKNNLQRGDAQPVVQHEMQISCPRCGSTQIASNKKGFNVGQALVGGLATGGLGLVAGLWGSNELRLNCLKCGNRWKPRA